MDIQTDTDKKYFILHCIPQRIWDCRLEQRTKNNFKGVNYLVNFKTYPLKINDLMKLVN